MTERHLHVVNTNIRPQLSPPNPATRERLSVISGGLPSSSIVVAVAVQRTVLTEAEVGAIMMEDMSNDVSPEMPPAC